MLGKFTKRCVTAASFDCTGNTLWKQQSPGDDVSIPSVHDHIDVRVEQVAFHHFNVRHDGVTPETSPRVFGFVASSTTPGFYNRLTTRSARPSSPGLLPPRRMFMCSTMDGFSSGSPPSNANRFGFNRCDHLENSASASSTVGSLPPSDGSSSAHTVGTTGCTLARGDTQEPADGVLSWASSVTRSRKRRALTPRRSRDRVSTRCDDAVSP